MNLLDYLRSAAKSETTVYTTFLQQYSKNNSAIHIFHEGKDDPSFYGNFLHSKVKKSQKIFYYQSKNKDKVYENYKKLNWSSYSRKRVLFFVDKDFQDILNISYPIDSNIFVTSYYSIENYLVDKYVFSRSLRELIGLDNEKSNSTISKQFIFGLKTFYNASLLLTAYILYHKKLGNPINLQNITISDMFRIDNDFVVKRKSKILSLLDRKTGVSTINASKAIRELINELKKINNPKKYTRGKFELSYMISCLNMTPDILNVGKVQGEKKYKCCVSISNGNAIQILAPRIKQPKEMKEFLDRNLK